MSAVTGERWSSAQHHEGELWAAYAREFRRPVPLLAHLARLGESFSLAREAGAERGVARALEVGIGPLGLGALAVNLPDAHVVAVEPLPRARLECDDPGVRAMVNGIRDRIGYVMSIGEALPFANATFDLVFCHNVVDHCRAPHAVIDECTRVLAPGGHLCLGLNTFSTLGRAKFELGRRRDPTHTNFLMHPHSFTHREVRAELLARGWAVLAERGGERALAGRARMSSFVCRRARD